MISLLVLSLLLTVVIRFYLVKRQIIYVKSKSNSTAIHYTISKLQFAEIAWLFKIILILLWFFGGGIRLLSQFWLSLKFDTIITHSGIIISFIVIQQLFNAFISYFRVFKLEQNYGFNKITLPLFLLDNIKKISLTFIVSIPVCLSFFYILQTQPHFGWIGAWIIYTIALLATEWLYPQLILPLFYQLTPLPEGDLKQQLKSLLKNNNIAIIDGSRRSTHGNAFFTGIGKNKRIILFDVLIKYLNTGEIIAIIAHELGHDRCFHNQKMLALKASSALIGSYCLSLMPYDISAATTWIVVLLLLPIIQFFIQPIIAKIHRYFELEADLFAQQEGYGEELRKALLKLCHLNAALTDNDPYYAAYYHSHPDIKERLSDVFSISS